MSTEKAERPHNGARAVATGTGTASAAAAIGRADFVRSVASGAVAAASAVIVDSTAPSQAAADSGASAAGTSSTTEEFVDYVDSRGLYSLRIPADFLRTERKNDKKGTLLVCGEYRKAEVISVQRIAASNLLADAGLPTIGDLSKWENVGKPKQIAELLKQRRDSDAKGSTAVQSVVLPGVSLDGDVLEFMLKSPITVMRADLLEEQQGVSELYRNTYVKAIMRGDGTFLVVWAGALNTGWDQEGGAKNRLKAAVDSFKLEGLVVDGVRLG